MNNDNKEKEEVFESQSNLTVDDIKALMEKNDILKDDNPGGLYYLNGEDSIPQPKKAVKVDLSKINIVDATELEKDTDVRAALYGNKSTFQIVAAQSGYMAKMTPLVHKDTINLLYSNLSRYEYKRAVFKVVYDKISAISSGKMTFEEWLKNTSVEDLETFFYGIYCSTFPDEGKFTFICPNCGAERTVVIKHNNLFKTTDKKEMKKLIKDITESSRDDASRKNFSLVGKESAYSLPDSGIIVKTRVPSLWDSLELLRLVPVSEIDKDELSATNMLYVDSFLIPSKKDKSKFIQQADRLDILKIVDNMSIDDAEQFQEIISEIVDNHRITYSIKNLKCPNCKETIEDIPVTIEDILFSLIFEKAQ